MIKDDVDMIKSHFVFSNKLLRNTIIIYLILLIDIILLNRGMSFVPSMCWGIMCFFTIFQDPETIFLELVLIAPVTHAFQLQNSITTFPIMAIILVIKLIFRNRNINKQFFLLYFSLLVINVGSTMLQYGTIKYVLPFFVYFLMMYLVPRNLNTSEYLYELCMKCFLLSVIIVCIGSKLLPVAADFMNNSTEYTVRNCGFSNVWDFGQNISISMTILLIAIKRKKINKIIAVFLFCFLSYFLIETGLYTALVGIAVVVVLYPILCKENGVYSVKSFFFSIIVVVLAILIGYFVIYPMMFSLRSQVSDNGRFELWRQYINIFCNNPRITLFGIGADSISAFASIEGIRTAHNAIIEKLVEFGVFGVVLLFLGIKIIMGRSSLLPTKNYRMIYAFVYLAMGMFQGISGAEEMFLFLIFACWNKCLGDTLKI